MQGQVWVDVVGEHLVARIRGLPTIELLADCQDRVVQLARESGRFKILYDVLEMDPPDDVDVPMAQRRLDEKFPGLRLRRAIIVPNSRLAYLARLAFGEGEYRVFYNDIASALTWLDEDLPAVTLRVAHTA